MKLASLVLLPLVAQAANIGSGWVSMNGASIHFETRLEPGSPPVRNHGSGLMGNKEVKRYVCNMDSGTYFGYDLAIDPVAGSRFRLRFSPLTITPREMAETYKKVPNWTPLPLPNGAATMEVRVGETVALDLFVNPSTGQKITDYLTVMSRERETIEVAGPTFDFGPEDAKIELYAPEYRIDGKLVGASEFTISGHALAVDIPGHGRFVFSLAPRPDLGMRRLGEIRGTALTWKSGGREFAIATGRAVTSGSRAYNLYVAAVPREVSGFGATAGPRPDPFVRR